MYILCLQWKKKFGHETIHRKDSTNEKKKQIILNSICKVNTYTKTKNKNRKKGIQFQFLNFSLFLTSLILYIYVLHERYMHFSLEFGLFGCVGFHKLFLFKFFIIFLFYFLVFTSFLMNIINNLFFIHFKYSW